MKLVGVSRQGLEQIFRDIGIKGVQMILQDPKSTSVSKSANRDACMGSVSKGLRRMHLSLSLHSNRRPELGAYLFILLNGTHVRH